MPDQPRRSSHRYSRGEASEVSWFARRPFRTPATRKHNGYGQNVVGTDGGGTSQSAPARWRVASRTHGRRTANDAHRGRFVRTTDRLGAAVGASWDARNTGAGRKSRRDYSSRPTTR
ncbi:Uncharacterised protein [Streptococcus pneumoniae]|nr:Uncharacterised protein [Streptococcus pneumoniae]